MGWVLMSERELNRVEVPAQVDDGRLTVDNTANMLGLTRRRILRLLKRYRQDGASAIRHKSRGRAPNNQIHTAKRDYALAVIKEQYPDFGPTLAAEILAEHHGFKVSRETVRKWMVEDGIWLSRKQRRHIHQPRLRRAIPLTQGYNRRGFRPKRYNQNLSRSRRCWSQHSCLEWRQLSANRLEYRQNRLAKG